MATIKPEATSAAAPSSTSQPAASQDANAVSALTSTMEKLALDEKKVKKSLFDLTPAQEKRWAWLKKQKQALHQTVRPTWKQPRFLSNDDQEEEKRLRKKWDEGPNAPDYGNCPCCWTSESDETFSISREIKRERREGPWYPMCPDTKAKDDEDLTSSSEEEDDDDDENSDENDDEGEEDENDG